MSAPPAPPPLRPLDRMDPVIDRPLPARRAGTLLTLTLLLVGAGCPAPAEPDAPARQPTPSTVPAGADRDGPSPGRTPPTAPDTKGGPVSSTGERGPDPRGELTHEQLLALDPTAVLAPGLSHPEAQGTAALAMAEQLRTGGVPLEALELVLVQLDRAREELPQGQRLDEAAFARLQRNLGVQTQGYPPLERWTAAITARLIGREDLEAAVALLERTRTTWAMAEELRRGGEGR